MKGEKSSLDKQGEDIINHFADIRKSVIDKKLHKETVPSKYKKSLELLESAEVTYDEEIKPMEVAIETVDEFGSTRIIGTLGNFSVVTGKAKARKSFLISTLTASAMGEKEMLGCIRGCLTDVNKNVVYFDTEQSRQHVQKALHRICDQLGVKAPNNFKIYCLRTFSPDKRMELIEAKLYTSKNLGVAIIDGIRDLIVKVNDEGESMNLVSNLMRWSEELHIHIMTVLHLNKGDGNLRGHLGTEAMNKAETVIEVEKSGDVSKVSSKESRNRDIDPFVFGIDENELPYLLENQVSTLESFEKSAQKKKSVSEGLSDEQRFRLLKAVFMGADSHSYTSFWKRFKLEHFKQINKSLSDNKCKDMLTFYRDNGDIYQKENDKDYYFNERQV